MERIDNRLTPSKIVRLMELAESATPQQAPALGRARRRVLAEKNIIESTIEQESVYGSSGDSRYNTRCESSGILDLDQCEVGEFCTGEMDKLSVGSSNSLLKSFYPSEMTGRSTGTTEYEDVADARSRDTNSIDELARRLQQQSCDVADIVRQSIFDYSFRPSQRDLSQDEMSFIQERGDLPVPPSQLDMNLTRTATEPSIAVDRTAEISVSSYFMKGCANLSKMLGKCSPRDISLGPSLIEGDSRNYGVQPGFTTLNDSDCIILDTSLDHIPTRQPRTVLGGTSGHAGTSVHAGTSGPAAVATALCAPQLQHLTQTNSARSNEDSTLGTDTSLSISLISKCLGKCESEVTPSLLLAEAKLKKNSQQHGKPALPTREPNASQRDTFTIPNANKSRLIPLQTDNPHFVTTLKQAGKSDTASSSSSVNTVIQAPIKTRRDLSPFKPNKENVGNISPSRNRETLLKKSRNKLQVKGASDCGTDSRANSPSNKTSGRTPVTVQENRISTSEVAEDSPLQTSKGEVLWSGFSPNYEYRELEQSVNWQELLRQQSFKGFSRWVEVEADPVDGYVGVRTTAAVKLTSVTDAFLTARLCLDESSPDNGSVAVDIPRLPVLLSPGAPEIFSVTFTAYKPVNETITMTVVLQDTCEDTETTQQAHLRVNFELPNIKIVTLDNKGVLSFPPTQYESETVKSFVMVSDCNKPLQLALSVSDKLAPGVFTIGSIEEIKRDDIEKRLSNNHRLVNEDGLVAGSKYRVMKQTTKHACVLTNQKALRVMMICKSPSAETSTSTLNGSVSVHLMGTHTLLQTIALNAVVGTIELLFQMTEDKLYLTSDPHTLDVKNAGTINGAWRTIVRGEDSKHFTVTPALIELGAGESSALHISHSKQNRPLEGLLVLESVYEGKEVVIELVTCHEKFPIKTTHSELSWVREGRKDISLKNSSERKVTVKCEIHGEGYFMEHPKDSGTEIVLTFKPNECIGLSVVYSPREKGCHKSKLVICVERDSNRVKSVRLNGWCGSGGGHMRWASGVLTCGEMGIAFARRRSPVTLTLENRSREPSFFSARLLFNIQYRSLAAGSRVSPSSGVLTPHGSALLSIELDWVKLEKINDAATTLASMFVLVGPEMSRRRILRILKSGQNEPASPAEGLSRLKGQFPGEDARHDQLIKDFDETMKSLPSIMESVQELTAQIELNRDSAVESSMIVADETAVTHYTMLE